MKYVGKKDKCLLLFKENVKVVLLLPAWMCFQNQWLGAVRGIKSILFTNPTHPNPPFSFFFVLQCVVQLVHI